MKKEIIVKQIGTRVYLRGMDIPTLKPVFNIAGIKLYTNPEFKHQHVPKYYIEVNDFFNFLQTARSNFIITML